jgi:hypothetical protein
VELSLKAGSTAGLRVPLVISDIYSLLGSQRPYVDVGRSAVLRRGRQVGRLLVNFVMKGSRLETHEM